jgi:cytochrome c biogenesis protein CcmG, thiol:disulfide interchange protein DsbE
LSELIKGNNACINSKIKLQNFNYFIVLGVLSGMFAGSSFATSPKVGQALPHFSARTLDGRNIDSDELLGKVTIVHFWATWCPPCREEMPALEKFYQAHHNEGLEIIAISIEDDEDKHKVLDFSKSFTFPVAMKSAAQVDGFGRIWGLPLSFLIDRKGILRKGEWTGEQKMDASSLETFVRPLLQ